MTYTIKEFNEDLGVQNFCAWIDHSRVIWHDIRVWKDVINNRGIKIMDKLIPYYRKMPTINNQRPNFVSFDGHLIAHYVVDENGELIRQNYKITTIKKISWALKRYHHFTPDGRV